MPIYGAFMPKRGHQNNKNTANALANMMKTISKEALLSKVYTNHSVRATAITLWSNAGIPNRHIMAISGHRNEQSLGHYNSRPSVNQLHNCSEVLSNALSSSTSCQPQNNVSQSQVLVSTSVRSNDVDVFTRKALWD